MTAPSEEVSGRTTDTQAEEVPELDPIAEAKAEGRAEGFREMSALLVAAEAHALAVELGFYYPADTPHLVDLSDVEVIEDHVDVDAIRTKLTALAEERPLLLDTTNRGARR